MALIDSIVSVNIQVSTLGLSFGDLSTILILGETKNTDAAFRIKTYSDLASVTTDYGVNTEENKVASLIFSQVVKPEKVLIGQVIKDTDGTGQGKNIDATAYIKAYQAVMLQNPNFYGVVVAKKDKPIQLGIANEVTASNKLFGVSSNDADILNNAETTNNIASTLKTNNNPRSFVVYNSEADTKYPEAAWMTVMLTGFRPGEATWAYKNLVGVKADNLTSDQINTLNAKNCNYYTPFGNSQATLTGKTSSGQWIDVQQGIDWIDLNLKTNIGTALMQNGKIPYTNTGIAMIENSIRTVLRAAANLGIIDKDSIVITVPKVLDISETDRGNRVLPNVTFEARLSGAIHKVVIKGTVNF